MAATVSLATLLHPVSHSKTPTNKLAVPRGALIVWSNTKRESVELKYLARGAVRDVFEAVHSGFVLKLPGGKYHDTSNLVEYNLSQSKFQEVMPVVYGSTFCEWEGVSSDIPHEPSPIVDPIQLPPLPPLRLPASMTRTPSLQRSSPPKEYPGHFSPSFVPDWQEPPSYRELYCESPSPTRCLPPTSSPQRIPHVTPLSPTSVATETEEETQPEGKLRTPL